jgi:hypothetical protein
LSLVFDFPRAARQVFETVDLRVHKKLCAILDVESGTSWGVVDGSQPIGSASDFAQTVHELLKGAFLPVMVAVADAHPAGVAPDAGGQARNSFGSNRLYAQIVCACCSKQLKNAKSASTFRHA